MCQVIWKAIFFVKCWVCISIFTGSYKHNKNHIFYPSPSPPTPPITTHRDFVGFTCVSVLNLDNLVGASIQLLGIYFVSLLDATKRDYLLHWQMGAPPRVEASNSQTLNMDRPQTHSRHFLKLLDTLTLRINQAQK